MIQMLLESRSTKRKRKRTLVTLFLKENPPHSNLPSKSRSRADPKEIPWFKGSQKPFLQKEREKRTLITFFPKEEPHPFKPTIQEPIQSRSKRNSMAQRFLEAVPTKKKGTRMFSNVLSQKKNSTPLKPTFQEPIQSWSKGIHDPNVLRKPFYKKKEKKNVSNVLFQRRTPPFKIYLLTHDTNAPKKPFLQKERKRTLVTFFSK
jgi:hypothetical protein